MVKLVRNPPDQFFTLRSGDNLFASEMQTLAIPVNTQGVMGKGLAKVTKEDYQGVFRRYRERFEANDLVVGRPRLIKNYESSKDKLLPDLPLFPTAYPLETGLPKYFLLFPTKEHWREKSKIEYIVNGLDHVKRYYKTVSWRLESLAMPALGCGLGGLPWREVGPVMCRALLQLDIRVEVYLPLGNSAVPPEQLTQEFLLGE